MIGLWDKRRNASPVKGVCLVRGACLLVNSWLKSNIFVLCLPRLFGVFPGLCVQNFILIQSSSSYSACACAYVHACICLYVCEPVHIHACFHEQVCASMCKYKLTLKYMSAYKSIRVHVYVCIFVCIRIYIICLCRV